MKKNKILPLVVTGALLATAASAQVQLVVTGSTAFRAIVIDRATNVFDPGSLTAVASDAVGTITYTGTMSNALAVSGINSSSLAATPITICTSFSGSGSGMLAVQNQTPVPCAVTSSTTVNKTPDVAFSDVYPASASPPIPSSAFDQAIVGVIPFVWVRNNSLTGVNNMTREQAVLLMTDTGPLGFPSSFLGGPDANPIYLIGRDSGSGTRITTQKDIGFTGTPNLYGWNGTAYVVSTGFTSGGNERTNISTGARSIGYLGLSDANAIAGSTTQMTYEGVAYSEPNVANGTYPYWGYEHVVNRVGGLSANQVLVKSVLLGSITLPAFQSSAIYTAANVRLNQMNVERSADGGPITGINF